MKELRELVRGQQHFVVLPAYEPLPVKERYVEHMSAAALAVVLREQQKVASFAAGSDKGTLQVCWQLVKAVELLQHMMNGCHFWWHGCLPAVV